MASVLSPAVASPAGGASVEELSAINPCARGSTTSLRASRVCPSSLRPAPGPLLSVLIAQHAGNRLGCAVDDRDDPRIAHTRRPDDADRSGPAGIGVRRRDQAEPPKGRIRMFGGDDERQPGPVAGV